MKIPKFIHQIWLGNNKMPDLMLEWRKKWADLHPGWVCLLWHEQIRSSPVLHCIDIGHFITLGPERQLMLKRAANLSQRTNIWRYNLMYWMGGLYVDTDVEPVKPIDGLVENLEAFTSARTNNPNIYECALIGTTPKHPWLGDLLDNLHTKDPSVSRSLGVDYFTPLTKSHPEVSLLPEKAFLSDYPSQWIVKGAPPYVENNRPQLTDDIYAIHHWSSRWFSRGFDYIPETERQI